MNNILSKCNDIGFPQVWLLFFFYSVFISLMIQLIVLPILFQQYHLGDGLLSSGDWAFYQREALIYSSKVNENGWSFWELRPDGFGIVGII